MRVNSIASNQTEVTTSDGLVILVSYATPVAAMLPSGRYVRTSKKWSATTTTRHINKWLQGITADVEEVDQQVLDDLL